MVGLHLTKETNDAWCERNNYGRLGERVLKEEAILAFSPFVTSHLCLLIKSTVYFFFHIYT